MPSTKKELGQFFTISDTLQQWVYDKVKYRGALLLEPSCGVGHLLKKFKEADPNTPMLCYELDTTLKPIVVFNQYQTMVYGDFLLQPLTQRFKTIIGNPPFVKKKAVKNLYIQFIEKCYSVLDDHGEMVFIVPSDFLKLTSAAPILQTMTENGAFTDFLFPHDEKLFEGAAVDVVVFRYEKGLRISTPSVPTYMNGTETTYTIKKGILTFGTSSTGIPFHERFNVYVGIVSGRDVAFRVPFGNIQVLCEKEKEDTFIYTDIFPTTNAQINAHLLAHKEELMARRIRRFTEANWFEWGALRNLSHIRDNWGKPCIYIRNMTRKKEVAFLGTVQYFSGGLLCLIPQKEGEPLAKLVQYFNSSEFQSNYLFAGRFKIGQKQVSQVCLPPAVFTENR